MNGIEEDSQDRVVGVRGKQRLGSTLGLDAGSRRCPATADRADPRESNHRQSPRLSRRTESPGAGVGVFRCQNVSEWRERRWHHGKLWVSDAL